MHPQNLIENPFIPYSFNGMEKDDEVKGEGSSYTTFFRQNDPRLGRWLSLDPKLSSMPWQGAYCSMDNNPVLYNDIEGDIVRIFGKRKEVKRYLQELNSATGNEYGVRFFSRKLYNKTGKVNSISNYTTGVSKNVSSLIETMINDSKTTVHEIVADDSKVLVDGFETTKIDIDDIQSSCDQVSKTLLIGFVMQERYLASKSIDYSDPNQRTDAEHRKVHDEAHKLVAKVISDFTGEKFDYTNTTETWNVSVGTEGKYTSVVDNNEYDFILLKDVNWNYESKETGSTFQVKLTTWTDKGKTNPKTIGAVTSDVHSVNSQKTEIKK